MKLSEKLSELAQSTADPLELVEKCREANIIVNAEQAQKIIDAHEMTELSEDDIDAVSGGYTAYIPSITYDKGGLGVTNGMKGCVLLSNNDKKELHSLFYKEEDGIITCDAIGCASATVTQHNPTARY